MMTLQERLTAALMEYNEAMRELRSVREQCEERLFVPGKRQREAQAHAAALLRRVEAVMKEIDAKDQT